MRRIRLCCAAALAVALFASACASPEAGPKVAPTFATSTASAEPSASAGPFAQYYSQRVEWSSCEDSMECASITVPLDWADPGSNPIKLALNRKPAKDADSRLGSIVLNPGGPGGSGTDYAAYAVTYMGKEVLKKYDIVGFDPRGVEKSDAVTCLNDKQMDAYRAATFTPTPEGIEKGIEQAKAFGTACAVKTGDLLGKVDTMSAVKDLDVIRAVLGDDKLNFLGFSYGTYLGAHYAQEFPERVGHFVLDGAMDPTLTSDQVSLGQAAAFEASLRAYVKECQAGRGCPLTGGVDHGMAQIRALLERTLAAPMATGTDRPLTEGLAFSAIISPMYNTDYWPWLTQALDGALRDNNGAGLLGIADTFADRDEEGHYTTNSSEANTAINCLDYPQRPTIEQMAVQAQALKKASPTLGPTMGYGDITCMNWPEAATGKPMTITATGAPTIVVIGTTHDPATPYQWAQSLAKQLDKSSLVTYEGYGHTAYGKSNSCISRAVEDFFTEDTVPKDGLKC